MQSQCKPGITACTTYSRPRFQHSTQKKRGRNEKGKGKGKGKARSATNVTVQHSQNNAMQPLQGSTCIKQQAVHPFGYRHSILKNTTKGEKEKCRATLHGSTHIKDNTVQPCLSSTLVNDAVQPLSGSTHIKDNAVQPLPGSHSQNNAMQPLQGSTCIKQQAVHLSGISTLY